MLDSSHLHALHFTCSACVFLLQLFVSPLAWNVEVVEVWPFLICEYFECVKDGYIFSASVNVLRNNRFIWSLFRISSAACVHLGILFVLVFVVYCESKPSTSWQFFMWFGFLDFISSVFESFLGVPKDQNRVFFTPFLVAKEERKTDGNTWCFLKITLVFQNSCTELSCRLSFLSSSFCWFR